MPGNVEPTVLRTSTVSPRLVLLRNHYALLVLTFRHPWLTLVYPWLPTDQGAACM